MIAHTWKDVRSFEASANASPFWFSVRSTFEIGKMLEIQVSVKGNIG